MTVLSLDSIIRDRLMKRIECLPQKCQALANCRWIEENSSSTFEKTAAKKKAIKLREEIKTIETTFELGYYLIRTDSLIIEYKKLLNARPKRSFVCVVADDSDLVSQRRDLTERYFRIAREYASDLFESYNQNGDSSRCSSCQGTIFDDTNTCTGCGLTLEVLDESPTFKDTDRINMCSRYVYTLYGHFKEAKKRFQGKQNTTITQDVYATLWAELENHSIKKEDITKDQIYMFLSENDLSQHYEDINLIHYVMTGIPPPDISMYDTELDDLFMRMERAYIRVKDPDRNNSLNVNYKLLKLLQYIGYNCRKEDFFILKTSTKFDEHDEKWREMCEVAGMQFKPTV